MNDDVVELSVDTRELDRALGKLAVKVQSDIMRAALQAAGDVLLEAQIAQAPERTDEETPGGDSLPPGALKQDLHTEIQLGTGGRLPRVKVGPSPVTGHVARWQNSGFNLTTHGRSRSRRRVIRAIPGKHFIEAAFDESAEAAVDVFLETLAKRLLDADTVQESAIAGGNSLDVEFDQNAD